MSGKQSSVWKFARSTMLILLSVPTAACVSTSEGPQRLFTVEEERNGLREQLRGMDVVRYSGLDEASRFRFRNDWIAARMYAIDIQYTAYEAALTRERQGVGFGAAAATLALTTASGLAGPVATKNLLTGLAGFVTGTRAAYDNDVLLAHSMQWIQSQMQARRAGVGGRILRGTKLSTTEYSLAAALSDLEAYYRAGTFTGGLIATSEVVAADAQAAEDEKAESLEVEFGSSPSTVALRDCLMRPGVDSDRLIALTVPPTPRAFGRLLSGDPASGSETRRNELLRRARQSGICP